MIQDIFPHRFYNEFRPDVKAVPESLILCFDSGKMLLGKEDRAVPRLSDLPEGMPVPVYAFSVDEKTWMEQSAEYSEYNTQ